MKWYLSKLGSESLGIWSEYNIMIMFKLYGIVLISENAVRK